MKLLKDLDRLVNKLNRWYSAELISYYSIHVYSKNILLLEPPYGEHLFDIYANNITWIGDTCFIPQEAQLVIKEIQLKMQEIDDLYGRTDIYG